MNNAEMMAIRMALSSLTIRGSKIVALQIPAGQCDAQSIHHGGDVDDLLRDGAGDGRKVSHGGSQHADHAQRNPAESAFKGNAFHAATDMDQLVHLSE